MKSQNKILISWLILFAIIGAIIIVSDTSIIWDEAVYLSMGKFLFSGGKYGYFEVLRPIALPILTGLSYVLAGGSYITLSKIVALAFSLAFIYATYLLGKECFDSRAGLVAAVLASLVPVFIFNLDRVLTDIPSALMVTLSLYFAMRKRFVLSGICGGAAFLFRFPSGLVLPAISLALLLHSIRKPKLVLVRGFFLWLGFMAAFIPFMILNFFLYTDYPLPRRLLIPVFEALWSQGNPGSAVVDGTLSSHLFNLLYYPIVLFRQNLIFLAFFIGLALLIHSRQARDFKPRLLLVSLAAFLVYYTYIINKQERFIFALLPAAAAISAFGLVQLYNRLRPRVKILMSLAIFILVASAFLSQAENFKKADEGTDKFLDRLVGVFQRYRIKGDVMTTVPLIAPYIDNRIHANFFSNEVAVRDFVTDPGISTMVYSTSSFWCPEADVKCEQEKNKTVDFLVANYNVIFMDTLNSKMFYIFSKDPSLPGINRSDVSAAPAFALSMKPLDRTIVAVFMDDVGSVDREQGQGLLWRKDSLSLADKVFLDRNLTFTWNVIPKELTLLSNGEQDYLKREYSGSRGHISLSQFGYEHKDNFGGSEFKGLPYGQQVDKIRAGREIMQDFFGSPASVFSPPFSSGDENTIKALQELNFTVYTSLRWDQIMSNFTRFDNDIRLVEQWSPPEVRDLSGLENEYDAFNSYKEAIVISVPFFVFNESNIGILEDYVGFISSRDALFSDLNFAHGWSDYIGSVNMTISGGTVDIHAENNSDFEDLLTIKALKPGAYTLKGDVSMVRVKNVNPGQISLILNGEHFLLSPGETVSIKIFK